MKSKVSNTKARRETLWFLEKRLQGSKKDITRQLKECLSVISEINKEFGISIYQLKYKHLHWYLSEYDREHSPKTRNNHWYTVLRIIEALGKEADWKPRLSKGPWIRKDADNSKPILQRRPSKKATPSFRDQQKKKTRTKRQFVK